MGKKRVESHFGCPIWRASGVRERKLKPDHFLGQHGVEVLPKRDMPPARALLWSLLAQGSSQTISICRGVNMSALRHQEATAIHVLSANRPAKFVSDHFAPAQLNRYCLDGEITASDLTAEHKDWISRLITARFAPASIGQSLTAA